MTTSLTPVRQSAVPPALLRLPAVGTALVSLERRLSSPGAMPLAETLVALFFEKIIKEHVEERAALSSQQASYLLPLTQALYVKRLAGAIGRVAKETDARTVPRGNNTSLDARLATLYFPDATLEDFQSAARFTALLGRSRADLTWRGGVQRSPVTVRERTLVGAILLRALQAVAFDVIEVDYTMPHAADVPNRVEDAVASLLELLESVGRAIGASLGLVPLPLAQARLQWALARAEGRVWLPLRAIPTAPLADADLADHYVGRSDDDARRLGHQIRRADGAILVSGYRGVGKSTFVNRVMYHTLRDQASGEANHTIVVPVTINLAKVAGVSNVLRLTLRGLRAALLDTAGVPLRIPGDERQRPLPIRATEREQLEWAYVRSTWKVAFTRARTEEKSWEVGTSVGFDPGKLAHWELGKLFSASAQRSRTEKVNRELALLDYDENAAEEDLQDLIRRLAEPRPLAPDGPPVGLKLVFIFDELDKMDQEKGVLPLIEGLKNLFLQQHAVFVLVTSKQLYYNLLKDRVREDSTLTSYFSSLVHVPLLDFAQVRRMLDDWVDSTICGAANTRTKPENHLLDQLARYLTYRSLGNPREVIRELRQMQQWGITNGPSYVTDALAESPQIEVFAGIQQCIEVVTRPTGTAAATSPMKSKSNNGVALASDRLSGDEARLEQVRRGLYVLVEELLDRQTLSLEASRLDPIRESNFTLLSTADVQDLAGQLGDKLTNLHGKLPVETFAPLGLSTPIALFTMDSQESGGTLRTNSEFYRLTGRQATHTTQAPPAQPPGLSEAQLIETAEGYVLKSGGWLDSVAALGMMSRIDRTKWTPTLETLFRTVIQDPDQQKRLVAIEVLQKRPDALFKDDAIDLDAVFRSESDEGLRTTLISAARAAETQDERKRATNAILAMLHEARDVAESRGSTIDALSALERVADRERRAGDALLDWLCKCEPAGEVLTAALDALRSFSTADIADHVFENADCLRYFSEPAPRRAPRLTGVRATLFGLPATDAPFSASEIFFRDVLKPDPLRNADRLIAHRADADLDISRPLAALCDGAFNPQDEAVPQALWGLAELDESGETLTNTLRTIPDFQRRIRPHLEQALDRLASDTHQDVAARVRASMDAAIPQARVPLPDPSVLANLWKIGPINSPAGTLGLPGIAGMASMAPPPRASVRVRVNRSSNGVVQGAMGAALLVTAFVINADIATGASLGTRLLSRGLSLLAALIVCGAIGYVYRSTTQQLTDRTKAFAPNTNITSDTLRQNAPMLGLFAVYAVYDAHRRYVGPLHFWNQSLVFVLNAVAITLLARAFEVDGQF